MLIAVRAFISFYIVLALCVTTMSEAYASVCVVIDREQDNLSPQQQSATRSILLSTFQQEGLHVDNTGSNCSETYVLRHIQLGKTINITITGPRGTRTARSTSLEDIPNHYSQIVKSLVSGTTMETGGGSTDRQNVTKEQSSPRRVAADNLKYVTIGYGAVSADGIAFGPAFGLGYRKELDRIGIDLSLLNLLLANDSDLSEGVNGSFVKLVGLFYQNPIDDYSLYYGGGFSYGGTAAISKGVRYSGSGLQGEITIGYEGFRSSTIRGFMQLNVTLPFYRSSSDGVTNAKYTPNLTINMGFGWGKSNVIRVINE